MLIKFWFLEFCLVGIPIILLFLYFRKKHIYQNILSNYLFWCIFTITSLYVFLYNQWYSFFFDEIDFIVSLWIIYFWIFLLFSLWIRYSKLYYIMRILLVLFSIFSILFGTFGVLWVMTIVDNWNKIKYITWSCYEKTSMIWWATVSETIVTKNLVKRKFYIGEYLVENLVNLSEEEDDRKRNSGYLINCHN